MPSLTGGEMPRKMARVIKSVIEVNIRSRNSKSRTINSLLGWKERKKGTNSTIGKEMEIYSGTGRPHSVDTLFDKCLNTPKFISDYVMAHLSRVWVWGRKHTTPTRFFRHFDQIWWWYLHQFKNDKPFKFNLISPISWNKLKELQQKRLAISR